jgi:cytochrome P450
MSVRQQLIDRVVEPVVLRVFRWRGDPVARLMAPETKLDPYPLYGDLRREPLVRSPLGPWASASHATVTAVLRDRRFSASPTHRKGYEPPSYPPGDPRAALATGDLLTMDPPDHTRIRRLVSRAFSPKVVADLEPWIREVVDGLLTPLDPGAGFDVIDALAFPLAIAVICHLLGVPAEDQASFREWGHDLAATLEPQSSAALRSQSRAAELALHGYLSALVDRRRADPDDSLLSTMLVAEEDGDRLSSDELVSTALLLLIAGFETTVNLIGNATVALLRSPDQWGRLCEEPTLIAAAVEETLRYDSPVQMTSRVATEDVELVGATIPQGASILVALGGANRDPDVFEEPDTFRLDRSQPAPHLAFSLGIHRCLGLALARLEARVALEELVRRYPRLELADAPTRRPLLVLRGFASIPVRIA